jgi:hypothetical protein
MCRLQMCLSGGRGNRVPRKWVHRVIYFQIVYGETLLLMVTGRTPAMSFGEIGPIVIKLQRHNEIQDDYLPYT